MLSISLGRNQFFDVFHKLFHFVFSLVWARLLVTGIGNLDKQVLLKIGWIGEEPTKKKLGVLTGLLKVQLNDHFNII
jgi:hypothetical protein